MALPPSKTLIKCGSMAVMGLLAVLLAGCNSTTKHSSGYGAKTVKVCSGFGCIYSASLQFSGTEMKYLGSTLASSQSAEEERRAISHLVGWKERLAEKRFGFPKDVRLSYQRNRGVRGQMDCKDESDNTLAFLKFLERNKMLKHHRTVGTATRGFFIDGRYPHTTAVLRQSDGTKWSVDSWVKNGGEEPDVIPLGLWRKQNSPG